MAVGKNKKLGKKKGSRKKAADPFLKKESYDIRVPAIFPVKSKSAGRTIATKTQGTKVARDTLMGRVIEVSLGDLKEDTQDEAYRKFKLRVEDVNGFNCLTQFHGMDLTTDKLRSIVRKWQTLIEAHVDIRTNDGYALRLFAIGFTKKHKEHEKKTAYASASQIRAIRKKMVDIMNKETASIDLNQLVDKLMNEIIGKEIERQTQAIYPLRDCLIRKVKMLRSPKVDVQKLVEAAGGAEALSKMSGALALGSKVVTAPASDAGTAVDVKADKPTSAASPTPAAGATTAAPAAKPAKPAKTDAKGGDKKGGDKKGGKAAPKGDAKGDKKKKDDTKKKA